MASTTDRGYNYAHKRLRRRWAREVEQGHVACARCRRLIQPGEPWDLDHDDQDRSRYIGPSHARCNRATAGRRPPSPRAAQAPTRHSRVWY
ncbi:hypothetical protein NBH00_12740 [Paraconexibacter antarcticus]|uniref:HNH endonuclease n=1 Tax=Paraconexibacter antarcticus TaxID=2949664 RepID=A0ABY5DNC9_9ACTN|nr:hypothetical protein [Paraconexibacter antarcticus]UTI62235.1 hypothetical protein NBH00_12740 [Paraconexibacter antarcticus]